MTDQGGLCLVCMLLMVKGLESLNGFPVIDAVAGGEAFIPCNVYSPLEDDEASLILWYRLDIQNPIYTLDIRNGAISSARHFPSTEMADRLNFNVKVHPPVLVISPVVAEDEADYKCRVDLRRSRTLILQSKLNVLVPPDEPIIMDVDGQRLQDVIGPYDEGSKLTLICDADRGDPSPSVKWWRGDSLLDDDFNVTTKGFVRNILTLNKIRRSDWMAQYFCKATNTHLIKPKVAAVQLDINLLPLDVTITGAEQPMLAGEKYDILCQTEGSRPAAITSWWFSGRKINSGISELVDEDQNVTLSVLEFIPTSEDNGKVLTCKSANPAVPKSTMEASVILNIHFIPVLNLTINGSNQATDAIEGEYVYLECSIRANPWISEVNWYFQQKLLTTNQPHDVFIFNQTLILKQARKEHGGEYHCTAENVVDRGRSNSMQMYIRFPPKCISSDPEMYVLSETEAINLTCKIEADPPEVSFRWALDSAQSTIVLQNWNSSHTFHYFPVIESGYGILSCWGRNRIGIQRTPCQFRLVIASIPDAPHSCTLNNLTGHAFSLECESGYNGSLHQTFHMEVYDSITEHLEHNLTVMASPNFKVAGLSSGTSYILHIYASNIRGRSNSMTLVTTTLLPAERRTAQETTAYINLILRILIGVVVSFCALSSLICLVLAIRKLRHKGNKGLPIEDGTISADGVKKDLEEAPDANEKGPDIIPQSAESEVFFMSGKLVETPVSSKTSPIVDSHRIYKHTVL